MRVIEEQQEKLALGFATNTGDDKVTPMKNSRLQR